MTVEFTRDVTFFLEVDTNKRTFNRAFALANYDSLADMIADVRAALDELEE